MARKPSPPLTAELASKIKHLLSLGRYHQHQIAALLGVNQGRISEVKRGRRWPDVGPSQPFLPGLG